MSNMPWHLRFLPGNTFYPDIWTSGLGRLHVCACSWQARGGIVREATFNQIGIAPALNAPRASRRAWFHAARVAARVAARWPDLLSLLIQAGQVFIQHATPILVLAMFAGCAPVLMGLVVQRLNALDRIQRGESVFAVFSSEPSTWVVQLIVAWVGVAFVRGVISHIALNTSKWQVACQMAWRRFPVLLVSTTLHGALTLFAALALDLLLCQVQLDVGRVGLRGGVPDVAARIVKKQSVDAAVVDHVVPADWLYSLRHNTPFARRYEKPTAPGRFESVRIPWTPYDTGYHLVVMSGALAWVVAYGLLCFRSVSVFAAGNANPLVAIGRSIGHGIRHSGPALVYGGLLRLALGVVLGFCVIAPTVFARDFALTRVFRFTGLDELRLTFEALMVLSGAFVASVVWAYEATFAAVLYRATCDETG